MKQTTKQPDAVTFNGYSSAAIVAKFLPPTNFRSSRVKVTSQRSAKVYTYPHDLSGDAVFDGCVAEYLAEIRGEDIASYGPGAKGWGELANWAGGVLPTGERVYVQIGRPV